MGGGTLREEWLGGQMTVRRLGPDARGPGALHAAAHHIQAANWTWRSGVPHEAIVRYARTEYAPLRSIGA
jgi:hypothetical protein